MNARKALSQQHRCQRMLTRLFASTKLFVMIRASQSSWRGKMFTEFRRERKIRKALRALARQRVAAVLQPHGVWVVEHAPTNLPFQDEAIRTCLLRGWVSVLEDAVPQGSLEEDRLPNGPLFQKQAAIYRLTEAGWMAINRSHTWVLATFFVALLTLLATVVMLWRS